MAAYFASAASHPPPEKLLRTQGQFAQVMFVQFAVGVSGFVQWERTRDVNFKRTGLDQTIELLDLLGIWLDIVTLALYAGRRFWLRHHTVRIGYTSVFLHRAKGAIGGLTTGGN